MTLHFDPYTQKGNAFLHELAAELGNPADTERAARVLRAVFHILRNHLSLDGSLSLLSQLPMALRSVYEEGWTPPEPESEASPVTELTKEIMEEDSFSAWKDFVGNDDIIETLENVLSTMKRHMSESEFRRIREILPEHLKTLVMSK
jgi:uncharacterized protein (DUF2267 family)